MLGRNKKRLKERQWEEEKKKMEPILRAPEPLCSWEISWKKKQRFIKFLNGRKPEKLPKYFF